MPISFHKQNPIRDIVSPVDISGLVSRFLLLRAMKIARIDEDVLEFMKRLIAISDNHPRVARSDNGRLEWFRAEFDGRFAEDRANEAGIAHRRDIDLKIEDNDHGDANA
jgi:hypothetical protein